MRPCGPLVTTVNHISPEVLVWPPTQPPTGAQIALRVYKGPHRLLSPSHLTHEQAGPLQGPKDGKEWSRAAVPSSNIRTHTA